MKVSRIVQFRRFIFPLLLILILLNSNSYTLILQKSEETNLETKLQSFIQKGEKLESLFQDSAVYYYQKGLESLSDKELTSDQTFLRIKVLTKIGQIFHQQSKYSLASDYYKKALKCSWEIEHDSLLAECNFNLAEICLENGSYSTAIESYKIAKELFEKINLSEGVFWTDIGLGIVYRELGNTEYSKKHYEFAKQLGESENRKDHIAISYNNLGNLFTQIGEYETALIYLQQALKSFETYGEEKFISDCLESIGEVYAETGDNNRAMEYFNKSTEIAEILGDNYRLLSRYANKAKLFAEIKDNNNALMYFSKTIELAQSIGDKARLSEVLIMVADFYRLNDDLESSLNNLNQSLAISKEVGDTVSMALAYNSLSESYFLRDNKKLAYESALKAFQISSQKDLKKTLSQSASKLSTILEIRGNHKDALYYFKIHQRTKDFLFNSEKIKIVEDTEAKYNIERIEREKLELENEALIREENIQKRNNLILALIIVLGLLGIISAWYIIRKRNEKLKDSKKSIRMKEKIDLLNNKLSERNRELTTKALLISQNNEVLKDVVVSIEDYLKNGPSDKNILKRLKNQLQEIYEEKSWDEFIHHFEQVHPKFYITLMKKCNDLSSMEQKVCAFLKMKLNTKDISQITGQSTKAIEVMRSRIRKKLELPHEESLTKTIQNI